MSKNSEHAFSNYGVHEVNERLEHTFSSTEIKIERIGEPFFLIFDKILKVKLLKK
jgi:hypothetical protein